MIGNKRSGLEVIKAEHMLTETLPCAGPWYRKEVYGETPSEALFLLIWLSQMKMGAACKRTCHACVTYSLIKQTNKNACIELNYTNWDSGRRKMLLLLLMSWWAKVIGFAFIVIKLALKPSSECAVVNLLTNMRFSI